MNYTLQLHGERVFYQVPPGLYELMSDISREVLRDQPEQVYKYISHYLDTLLKLRTNTKKATDLVDDVISENNELFAYIDSLRITWKEATDQARVIQRAWRGFRARKEVSEEVRALREKKLGKELFLDHSPSFISYFECLRIDYNTANNACLLIQSAFRSFLIRKKMKAMDKSSTHTIDVIAPDLAIPLVLERATTRNSKLLVYEQSPCPSINSKWFKPLPDQSNKGDRGTSFLKNTKEEDEVHLSATLETPLPHYFNADQSKIPMISKSGQLDVLEEDVVTLFSTHTFHVSESFVGAKQLPSFKELGSKSSKSVSETEKELFSIIEKKSFKGDRSVTTDSKESNFKEMMGFSQNSFFSLSQKLEGRKGDIPKSSVISQKTITTLSRISQKNVPRPSQNSQSNTSPNNPIKSKLDELLVNMSEDFEATPEL